MVSSPQPFLASQLSVSAIVAAVDRVRKTVPTSVALVLGIGLLIGSLLWSIPRSIDSISDVSLPILAVAALIGVPVMIALHSLEFVLLGKILDVSIGHQKAFSYSLVATISNSLPIPGASLVRIHVLTRSGVTIGQATRVQLLSAGVWAALSFSLLGAIALTLQPLIGVVSLALGAGAFVASMVVMRSVGGRHLAELVVIKMLIAVADSTRYFFVLAAIGVKATWLSSFTLSTAGLLTSIVGIFPAGIGLREGLAAVLATAVRADAADLVAASAADRLAVTVVLALMFPFAAAHLRKISAELDD
ncbi:MAG: hypothetical protein ACI8TP_000575 [Acidimicrobiales bacterium]|jgi:hypothetical protein